MHCLYPNYHGDMGTLLAPVRKTRQKYIKYFATKCNKTVNEEICVTGLDFVSYCFLSSKFYVMEINTFTAQSLS